MKRALSGETRSALAGLFLMIAICCFIVLSAWLLIKGSLQESASQILLFFQGAQTEEKTFSFEAWDLVLGFVLLNIWLSVFIGGLTRLITKNKIDNFRSPKIQAFLKLSFLRMNHKLISGVAGEEIVCRWFPLQLLYSIWETKLTLWILIVVNSLIFGYIHIFNWEAKDRKLFLVIPQTAGGFILSYIFLFYGFQGATIVHLIEDIMLIYVAWIYCRLDPAISKGGGVYSRN